MSVSAYIQQQLIKKAFAAFGESHASAPVGTTVREMLEAYAVTARQDLATITELRNIVNARTGNVLLSRIATSFGPDVRREHKMLTDELVVIAEMLGTGADTPASGTYLVSGARPDGKQVMSQDAVVAVLVDSGVDRAIAEGFTEYLKTGKIGELFVWHKNLRWDRERHEFYRV